MLIHRFGSFVFAAMAAVSMGTGAGAANADVTSTLTADGFVRTESAHYHQAPEVVVPSSLSGCKYWEMSTRSSNGNATQRFHAGFARLVAGCSGDGA